jgi:Glycosyltransferase family 87
MDGAWPPAEPQAPGEPDEWGPAVDLDGGRRAERPDPPDPPDQFAPGRTRPGGARPGGVATLDRPALDRPTVGDPLVRAASAVIGGPAGKRMAFGRSRFGPGATGLVWLTVVLSLLSALTLGAAVLEKEHCRTHGWNSPDQFWHACYSDIPVLYNTAHLGTSSPPTLITAVGSGTGSLGQPPLASAAMWVTSKLSSLVNDVVGGGSGSDAARLYFDVSAVLLAALLAVAVAAVVVAAGRRPWDAAHLALAPVLVTGGLISYDLLAVALLATSLLAWTRRRPALAGALLGAAIATRPLTSAMLLVVLVLAVRTGRTRLVAVFGVPALAVWLGLRVVLLAGVTGGLPDAFRAWRASGPGYGSLWLIPSLIAQSQPSSLKIWSVLEPFWYRGSGLSGPVTTTCVLVGLVLVGLATVFVGLSVGDRPRLAHLALFATAGCLLMTKSVPVQAGLVLLPLIALAGLRWRDHLIWATTELVYFVGVWLYIAAGSDPGKGLPATMYLLMLLARVAGYGWLMAQAVRAMRDPGLDPVRVPADGAPGIDDPQGGEFDGSSDALVIRMV